MVKKEIRAVYSNSTIRVYQAFGREIADEAIVMGRFGPHFRTNRMTWIKPSFLWMMYRCGWAEKENQEHVLAIDLRRDAFDYIVRHAIISTYSENCDISKSEWKRLIEKSDLRCQWDPERDVWGNALNFRTIQLGLRGQAILNYINDWIVDISDITVFVKELNRQRTHGLDITPNLPKERVYTISTS